MAIEDHLGIVGDLITRFFGDPCEYTHTATGEKTTVYAFKVNAAHLSDPLDKPSMLQDVPAIRAKGIPWTKDEIRGDTIVVKGVEWTISAAYVEDSGIYNLEVDD